MKECCIFAGAKILDYSKIHVDDTAFIICADGGYTHVKKLGLIPAVILGDFDSLRDEITEDCEIIKYSSEKDDTDTMLAIKLALDRNYTDIKIFGAVGGRLDHTIANIQALAYIHQNNAIATIYGDNEIVSVMGNGEKLFKKLDGYYFSIFSFSEKCFGVSTEGLKYNLKNAVLTNTFPLGISNEIQENFAKIHLNQGKLLIIYSKH